MSGPAAPDKPPRVAWGLYGRFAAAGAIIIVLTAAAVATAGLLKVKDVVDTVRHYGHTAVFTKGTITPAKPGKAQTILLVGSDHRYGQGAHDARSDTLMLLRLDPHQEATAILSIPRDLVVTIPGRGQAKINEAYSLGGLNLTTRTVRQLLGIEINHAVEVSFRGFRRLVDFVGCVYVDVDRRYYHSNLGLPPSAQYAEIDIDPGYQKLCGQKALDYVRYRHLDNDVVRAARQQDFVRQAKTQVSTSHLLSSLTPLVKIFAESTETDPGLQSESGVLRLLKLAIFSAGHPIREVPFPAQFVQTTPHTRTGAATTTSTGLGDYVTVAPAALQTTVHEFLHAKASTGRRRTAPRHKSSKAERRRARHARRHTSRSVAAAGLVDARTRGENLVANTIAAGRLHFPLYFPAALTPLGRYPASTSNAPMPQVYSIVDRAGRRHRAYRLVVAENALTGQYYGIQGTTWKTPPILARNGRTRRTAGRTYKLYYDGGRLRLVAWTTPHAVYWVSNTLSLDLSNEQMLGIARSLTRVGQKRRA